MHFTELRYQDPATRTYLGSPSLVRLRRRRPAGHARLLRPGLARSTTRARSTSPASTARATTARTWTNVTHISAPSGAACSCTAVQRLPAGRLAAVRLHRHPPQRRRRQHLDPPGRRDTAGCCSEAGLTTTRPTTTARPVPVLLKDGRLYRAFEDCDPCRVGHRASGRSSSRPTRTPTCCDASILDDEQQAGLRPGAGSRREWGELVTRPAGWRATWSRRPTGELWNILRFHSDPLVDKAAVVRVQDEGRRLSLRPADRLHRLPRRHDASSPSAATR